MLTEKNLKCESLVSGSSINGLFKLLTSRRKGYDIITGRNEVVAKVMFLLVSVILSTGGGGVSDREAPPGREAPPDKEAPLSGRPPWQGDPPAGRPPGQGDPPSRETPRHTVNERPVRILLECILVYFYCK